jgi:hypothetical protein
MSLKLGNVFLRPSPPFTLRHINLHEKSEQPSSRITFNDPLPSVHAVLSGPTRGRIGTSERRSACLAWLTHLTSLTDALFDTARFDQLFNCLAVELDAHLDVAALSGFSGKSLILGRSLPKFCRLLHCLSALRFVGHCRSPSLDGRQSRHFALQKTESLFADHDKQTLSPRCMTVAKSNRLRHIENGHVEPYSLSLAIVESRGSIGEGGR